MLARRTGVADRSSDRIAQIGLALQVVPPGRRVGVLKISHENVSARIQRIDDHLPVDWASDLHTPVLQIVRNWGDLPFLFPNVRGFGKKVWQLASINVLL